MSDIQIRPLFASDAPRVAELSRELGYEVSTNDASLRIAGLEARRECAYAGLVDSLLVGWIHAADRRLLQEPPVLEIGGLVVAETSRGKGVGQRLVEAVNRWGRKRGHTQLFVRSNVTRSDAHGFYEVLGFVRDKTSHTFSRSIL
ncbi:MAG: GNAT family N-acetyltransferase [bacterium]|nr:GNAT family N-acetyltransferase [bacterium]